MPIKKELEIERKFLVIDSSWKKHAYELKIIKQGYIESSKTHSKRVRLEETIDLETYSMKNSYYITEKKSTGSMITREEKEYDIPMGRAVEYFENCGGFLIKNRWLVEYGGKTWEIDEFIIPNHQFTIAEIELSSEDEEFAKPSFIGEEVTQDEKYINANLTAKAS